MASAHHGSLACSAEAFPGGSPRSSVTPGLALPSASPGEQRLCASLPWAHTLVSAAQGPFPAHRSGSGCSPWCELDGLGVNCDRPTLMSRLARSIPEMAAPRGRSKGARLESGSARAPA